MPDARSDALGREDVGAAAIRSAAGTQRLDRAEVRVAGQVAVPNVRGQAGSRENVGAGAGDRLTASTLLRARVVRLAGGTRDERGRSQRTRPRERTGKGPSRGRSKRPAARRGYPAHRPCRRPCRRPSVQFVADSSSQAPVGRQQAPLATTICGQVLWPGPYHTTQPNWVMLSSGPGSCRRRTQRTHRSGCRCCRRTDTREYHPSSRRSGSSRSGTGCSRGSECRSPRYCRPCSKANPRPEPEGCRRDRTYPERFVTGSRFDIVVVDHRSRPRRPAGSPSARRPRGTTQRRQSPWWTW